MQPENRNLPAPLPTEPGVLTMTSCGPVAFCLEKIRGWTPAEPLPTGLTVETVSMAITALSDAAKPASPQQMAVLVGHIRHFGQLFGLIQFSEDDAQAPETKAQADARRAAPHRRPSRGCRRPLARDHRRREGLPLAPDGVGRP